MPVCNTSKKCLKNFTEGVVPSYRKVSVGTVEKALDRMGSRDSNVPSNVPATKELQTGMETVN